MLSPKIRCEGIEIIEAKALAPAHPKRGKISYVEEVMKLIKEKCLGI
jgi:hypothetical protein